MSEELFLTLGSVFTYLNCNAESRSIVEGEEILNSKHIIMIGITKESEDSKDVFALCLQTSALKSFPHEIKGNLFICNRKINISPFHMHLQSRTLRNLSNINALEKLSTTDVKCYWTEKKKVVNEEYEAKPLVEIPCFTTNVTDGEELKPEIKEDFFRKVLAACSGSALTLHLKGRTKIIYEESESPDGQPKLSEESRQLVGVMEESQFLDSLEISVDAFKLNPCCKNLYEKEIGCTTNFYKCLLAQQRSILWEKERKLRITGSRCYSIYTYAKDDWAKKTKEYFWPKKICNKYVEHGLKFEQEALDCYANNNNYKVLQLGLVICKKYPWLAYSPDGVVLEGSGKLVEIKCPYNGIETDAINFVHS
ncbi:hypothetical protein NQ315_009066, partial [Exocentrus adspersus]